MVSRGKLIVSGCSNRHFPFEPRLATPPASEWTFEPIVLLAAVETDGGRPIYRMSLVKGQEQIERTERHQKKWGFTKRPSDEGIIGVISDDQSTVLTTTWNPTHHLQANQKRTFSCIHANPFFGSLQPGETRTRRGCVLLTPGDLSQAWDATKKVSEQL